MAVAKESSGSHKEVITAGPWHMRFFRLGKIRIFQNRMTDIYVGMYVIYA